MLKGVTKRGTAKSLRNFKYEIAGKTGTTNDNMDAWFLGFSPELAVGVYVGYDTPKFRRRRNRRKGSSSYIFRIYGNCAKRTKNVDHFWFLKE